MPLVPVSRMIPVGPVFPVRRALAVVSVLLMIPVAPVLPGFFVAAVFPSAFRTFPAAVAFSLLVFFSIVLNIGPLGLRLANYPGDARTAKISIISEFSPVFPPSPGFLARLRYFCTHFVSRRTALQISDRQ